jgi:hypothetical protein
MMSRTATVAGSSSSNVTRACAALFCLFIAAPVRAQDASMPGTQHDTHASEGWHWMEDASVFFGFNDQERRFRDFRSWESQNWMMVEGAHPLARGSFRFFEMSGAEPWTMQKLGTPQVFQTGETFGKAPLIDYQHPHDLFMGLGAEYTRRMARASYTIGADVVGSPTLGPTAFMHRPSAYGNPQAPLAHHYLDSTHITPGVLRGVVTAGGWSVGTSWFRGEEPDENRKNLDLGRPDSYALQVSWARGPWSAQASGARLHRPELITPYDADKLTGSVAYTNGARRLNAWMFAFGQKREIHGNFEAYLVEATIKASTHSLIYTRAESVDKDILDAGFHPRGVFHRHRHSQVGAITIGYLYDFLRTTAGNFGVGADVTGYGVPSNLQESYGSPSSYHVFVHYSLRGASGATMSH